MARELGSSQLPLFIPTPNNRCEVGGGRDRWLPPPGQTTQYTKEYEFVGRLFGLSMRIRAQLPLNLPSLVWKQLARETVTLDDLNGVDTLAYNAIHRCYDLAEQVNNGTMTEADFDAAIASMTLPVTRSDGSTIDLGGVTMCYANHRSVLQQIVSARLNEFPAAIKAIAEGFEKVIPPNALSLLSWSDLESAVCGHGVTRADFELLKRQTTYSHPHSASSQQVQWLWQYLIDEATDDERSAYVQFCWGRSRLPSTAEDYERKHLIQGHSNCRNNAASDQLLPKSHTCGFAFDCPMYRSYEVLKNRVQWAILNCGQMDGD